MVLWKYSTITYKPSWCAQTKKQIKANQMFVAKTNTGNFNKIAPDMQPE